MRERVPGLFCSILLILALASLAGVNPVFSADPSRPNIVFIIADDMTRDMFNFLPEGRGRNLTPNLDRLAREGTQLLGQYVASPVCTPSRYSCLTGRFASRASNRSFIRSNQGFDGQLVVRWNTYITAGEVTLPKLLREGGYETGSAGKNHVIETPDWVAVDYLADPRDPEIRQTLKSNRQAIQRAYSKAGFDYAACIHNRNPDGNGPRGLAVHNLDWHAQGALEFIERYKAGPFFLYFAPTVPHGPTVKERSWGADRRITPYGYLRRPLSILSSPRRLAERLRDSGIPLGGGGQLDRKANLLWLDDAVGALLSKLEAESVLDNTIVFFFNDHGQGAKGTLYQTGILNPSVVWRKGGFPVGGISQARISNIDFAPTILDLAGVNFEEDRFDGKSFKSLLLGRAQDEIHESLYFEMGFSRAVIRGDYKYLCLRYPNAVETMSLTERSEILRAANERLAMRGLEPITLDPAAPFSHLSAIPGGWDAERTSTGKFPHYYDRDQLYDIVDDPGETRNLAKDPAFAEKLAEMKTVLRNYVERLPGKFLVDEND